MKFKKIITIIVIILILACLLGLLGFHIYNTYFCSTEVTSFDNSFKLTIPNRVKFKVKESTEPDYSLDFYSVKDEMFFYSTVINKQSEIVLKDVVNEEKLSLNTKLKNFNLISDLQELKINNHLAYKYTYSYTDSEYGSDLYAEVVWIETDAKIYILDLEVVLKNIEKYKPIFDSIEKSFIEIS